MKTTAASPDKNLASLPDTVRARCRGPMPRPDADTIIELVTCALDGWPHVAQLSVGELDLGDDGLIRLALWRHAQSAEALAAAQAAVLFFVGASGVFEVRCRLVSVEELDTEIELTGFLLAPVAVPYKQAPYAEILSGSRFRLFDPAETERRWVETRHALRARFPQHLAITREKIR
jgi:hypothetical protein